MYRETTRHTFGSEILCQLLATHLPLKKIVVKYLNTFLKLKKKLLTLRMLFTFYTDAKHSLAQFQLKINDHTKFDIKFMKSFYI